MMAATAAFQDELLSELGRGSEDDEGSFVDDEDEDHATSNIVEPDGPLSADVSNYYPPSPSVREYERMIAATSSFNVGAGAHYDFV